MWTNPFCPVSLGFLGFLGAVVSRRGFLWGEPSKQTSECVDEVDSLLENDLEAAHELSEDKISRFLESQKHEYYKSIGMEPPEDSPACVAALSLPVETFAMDTEDFIETAPSTPVGCTEFSN